ncbi:MAG: hypothetical protein QOE66_808 [Chloroflexota bacterium]|jgi:hypothetical protein|nr:hypothetical protein [Chloroflexota bacterium]
MDQPLRPPDDADSVHRPVLLRPAVQIHSPILRHGSTNEPPARDPLRPSLVLPPIRALVRPALWSVVAAIPLLVRVGWQAALVAAALVIVVREVRVRVSGSTVTFGGGFLPYRASEGWPHGVQEDDDVRWHWPPVRAVTPARGARD